MPLMMSSRDAENYEKNHKCDQKMVANGCISTEKLDVPNGTGIWVQGCDVYKEPEPKKKPKCSSKHWCKCPDTYCKRYCNFVLRYPLVIFLTAGSLCFLLSAVALILRPPDFRAEREAFYTWGTDISGRLNTWRSLQIKVGAPIGPTPGTGVPVPLEITGITLENLEKFQTLTTKADPTAPGRKITLGSTYCPNTQLVTIVLEAKNVRHLLSAESLMDLCEMDGILLKIHEQNAIKECNQHSFSGPLSLYSALHGTRLLNRSCEYISGMLMKKLEIVGDLKSLFSLPVNTFRPELAATSTFEDTFLSANALSFTNRRPIYTSVFLASENLTHTSLDTYMKIIYHGFPMKSLTVRGLFVNELAIASIFEGMISFDLLVLAPISGFLVFCVMWIYTCSFVYTTISLVSLLLAFGTSYFLYFFVYQMEKFWFTNYLAAIILLGIGTDDTFVLFHSLRRHGRIQYSGEPDCPLVESFKHAILAMFVTTATTAIAFMTNLITGVIAIKAFGVFATTVVIVNYFLVITWLPASLVIIDRYLWRDKSNERIKWLDAMRKFGTFAKERIFRQKLCLLIDRIKFFLAACLLLVVLSCTLIVSVWPKIPFAESPPQLFHTHHPIQWFLDKFHQHFDLKQPPVKETLFAVWGVNSKDTCSQFHRARACPLSRIPSFRINLRFMEKQAELCRILHQRHGITSQCYAEAFQNHVQRTACPSFPQCYKSFSETHTVILAGGSLVPSGPIIDADSQQLLAYVQSFEAQYPATAHNCKNVTQLSDRTRSIFSNAMLELVDEQLNSGWIAPTGQLAWDTLYRCDAQKVLQRSTMPSVALALAIALVVVICVTRNIKIGFASVFVIGSVIMSAIACLSLGRWELNVVESIIVSLGVGLSFDYTLHYAVAYKVHNQQCESIAEKITVMLEVAGLPVFLSALGTFLAGLVFCFAKAYPFFQVGIFMVIITVCSWVGSTFLFTSFLTCIDWAIEFYRSLRDTGRSKKIEQ